ncbi:MAG: L-ribulose-5-phosphate 4-epimerase [Acidobacteria bacterium]|nr:L-ribulose-5-phosphate 4-epimerase [Acidobacteriota bacterium]
MESLRREVLEANLELVRRGLVMYTWGNASGISRAEGLVAIKPSGVPYEEMKPEHMVITDLSGRLVDGQLKPSSDLDTHLALYREYPAIGGVVHTHSIHATSWAQAAREIPCLGTTHADYFRGPVPVTAFMSREQVESDYELNTGHHIIERLKGLDPLDAPGILVAGHGPFCWGKSAAEAAHNAVVLEELARMALYTLSINAAALPLPGHHVDKHFLRKHGANAYYGQSAGASAGRKP